MRSRASQPKRRQALDQEQGVTLGKYEKSGLPAGLDAVTWRREYKRLKRRKEGAQLRAEITAKAQSKREAETSAKALKQAVRTLHDAHVKRYTKVLLDRARFAKRYQANPEAERDRVARYKQKLTDRYVIQNLKAAGISPGVITPSLIELKREAMQYGRLARHIKSTVKNHLKEQNETITKHP